MFIIDLYPLQPINSLDLRYHITSKRFYAHNFQYILKNWIPVDPEATRAVVYLRAYEPPNLWGVELPTVSQNGQVLVSGGRL